MPQTRMHASGMERSCLREITPISVILCSMRRRVKADVGWTYIGFNGSKFRPMSVVVFLWVSSSQLVDL